MMPMERLTLHVTFLSPWHCGAGHGGGSNVDAAVVRDDLGLPYVPGRTLKGVLRHALDRVESWGHLKNLTGPASATQRLFGSRHGDFGRRTLPGCLAIDNARLPEAELSWLSGVDRQKRVDITGQMIKVMQSTAIAEATGTARAKTLRSMEVAIPMTLQAEVTYCLPADPGWAVELKDGIADPAPHWKSCLDAALPLVTAIGANRTRGYGRVRLSWG